MKNLLKNIFTIPNILMSVVFLLVNVTSVIVVTQIMKLNLPLAFLATGVNTILFHFLTKHKLPSVLGISGLYIGSILLISQKYSVNHAMGGVVLAGILYILFSLVMFKWQDKIVKLIPNYLLATIILLIALNLIPIGSNLVNTNLLVGITSMATMLVIELFASSKIRLFSMPIGIAIGTLVQLVTKGLDFTPLSQPMTIQLITPYFNLESFLTISLIAFAVVFEALGDCKNTGDIAGIDVFKEVGLGRILLANGLGTVFNGFTGSAPSTTYSEENSAVQITEYKNPHAQIITSLLFILLAFVPVVSKFILCIPIEAFGGVLLFLFATVAASAIKQVMNSGISLETNKKAFIIVALMIAVNFITFNIKGVGISSIAIATFLGILLQAIVPERR